MMTFTAKIVRITTEITPLPRGPVQYELLVPSEPKECQWRQHDVILWPIRSFLYLLFDTTLKILVNKVL